MLHDDSAKSATDLLGVIADLLHQAITPLEKSSLSFTQPAVRRVQSVEILVRDILKDLLRECGETDLLPVSVDASGARRFEPVVPASPLAVIPRSAAESELLAKVARAQEAFHILDTDQSGSLDVSELAVALRYMGVKEDRIDEVLEHVLQKCDPQAEQIGLDEFISLFTEGSNDETINFLQEGFKNITEDLINEFNKRAQGMVVGEDQRILIDPRSPLSTNWDIYVAILLVATIFTMPLSMAFLDIQKALKPLDLLADITFLTDMGKHFNTGFVDDFEFTIMDRKIVRWNYLTSWFIPDLLSSFPIEILELILNDSGGSDDSSGDESVSDLRATKLVKLLRLSRIAKVFRIMKLSRLSKLFREAQDSFEDFYQVKVDEASLAMGRLFLSLLVLAHWIGCINFMICREYGFPEDSWVTHADLVNATTATQYYWCFFKALIAMIGLGFESPPLVNTVCTERTPWCTVEHGVTLVCLYIGSIFYALLISSVSFVMANLDKGGSNLAEKLWGLSEYLQNKKVPVSLKDQVRSFFRLQYSEGKMYEHDILAVLPRNLQREIFFFNERKLFDQVPLFRDKSTPRSLLTRLAPVLSSQLIFSSEVIFEEDTTGSEMYFIASGIVQIISKFYEPVVKAIADGCYFGDVACLLGCKRTATTKARTNVTLNVLRKQDLLDIVSDYQPIFKRMVQIAEKRRLRVSSLNHAKVSLDIAEDDLVDDEDAGTKYFMKVKGLLTEQDTVFKAEKQRKRHSGDAQFASEFTKGGSGDRHNTGQSNDGGGFEMLPVDTTGTTNRSNAMKSGHAQSSTDRPPSPSSNLFRGGEAQANHQVSSLQGNLLPQTKVSEVTHSIPAGPSWSKKKTAVAPLNDLVVGAGWTKAGTRPSPDSNGSRLGGGDGETFTI
mmetsp:Transcript_67192/g.135402  ORF Transcript_67192/g.135402 Transcript_67192/m.135402 type:complete len:894 (+) Transcript_67192:59-2740(+)